LQDSRNLARVFKALSVDSRVRIIQILKERSMCVNALAIHLDMTPPAVSQHLRVLRDNGIVIDSKCGNFVHYRLNPETLADWKSMAFDLLSCATLPESCGGDARKPCG
jgi:DNA-binding transcriptional ArsR family regulator